MPLYKKYDNRNSTYDSYAFTYDGIGRMLNATYTDHSNDSSVKFTENVASHIFRVDSILTIIIS